MKLVPDYGLGMMDHFKMRQKKHCKYYYKLESIMGDRSSSAPKSTSEELGSDLESDIKKDNAHTMTTTTTKSNDDDDYNVADDASSKDDNNDQLVTPIIQTKRKASTNNPSNTNITTTNK
jgi:hypothetical protein